MTTGKSLLAASALCLLTVSTQPALADFDLDHLLFDPQLLSSTHASSNLASSSQSSATTNSATPFNTRQAASLSDIADYNESIADLVVSGGPFAQALIQEYFALGQSYQSLGQHERAIEAFEEAEYLSRIHEGLNSPEAFALIEATIASHMALGDLGSANRKQQYLFYLSQDYYGGDSVEVVPLLSELGDWHMDSFSTTITAIPQPTFSIRFGMGGGGQNNMEPNSRQMAFGNLLRAQGMYYQAINNLVQHRIMYAPELLELEKKLVEATFLAANREGFLKDPVFFLARSRTTTGSRIRHSEFTGLSQSYVNGRNAYLRMRAYLAYQNNTTPVEVARIIIAQADWHLLYTHHARALQLYAEALQYMQSHSVPSTVINELLHPVTPVQLPEFTALPHSRAHHGLDADTPVDYAGYIDVGFELSRYGKAKKLKVLGKSDSTTAPVERRLKRLLHSTPFRPRILESESAEANNFFQMRYYFAEVDPAHQEALAQRD